jgi:hypothetical protein
MTSERARTLSSTNHHAGELRLIRAVRPVRGSTSVWLRFVAADAIPARRAASVDPMVALRTE